MFESSDGDPSREGVDVLVLTRDGRPPRRALLDALDSQRGSRTNLHVVPGPARPDDPNRWATIARARNAGRRLGSAPFVLFLDDDVVPDADCVATLVGALKRRPDHAAIAADYLGESREGPPSPHVGMGATLFRREVLAFLGFRWEPGRCECQCACDDLRAHGFGIDYEPAARARHDKTSARACERHRTEAAPSRPGTSQARVIAVFDRRHFARFRRQFLGTLRGPGNHETVTALAYGLQPLQRRLLAGTPGVEPVFIESNGVHPAIRRLRDLPAVMAGWPPDAPAAYWDAGDVVFQSPLGALWETVRAHPDRLLVAREPLAHPANEAVASWTLSVRDPAARARAFGLLSTNPFINAGFAAGTVRALSDYFREADRLLHSKALAGTADWGDQTALNLYCHSDPSRYREISEGWNYCLCHRDHRAYRVRPDGFVSSTDGTPVHVVHGNAGSFHQTELSHLWDDAV